MLSRWIALTVLALLASGEANAACVLSGARPTVSLPTRAVGQEFSFVASHDCETLRFTIRGTTVAEVPKSGGPVGPGPHTYKVVLTESEWNAIVAESGSTLTWIVTGRTSAGVPTRMVTTNDLKRDETIPIGLSLADAKLVGEESSDPDEVLVGARQAGVNSGAAYLIYGGSL